MIEILKTIISKIFLLSNCITLFLWPLFDCRAATQVQRLEKLPESVKVMVAELLKEIPEGALTLDYVMKRALISSDSFKSLKADHGKITSPWLKAKSIYDPQFYAQLGYQNNENEPAISFEPNSKRGWSSALGIQGHLPTGTQLKASVNHQKSQLGFAASPDTKYHYNQAKIEVSQSLLKDFFGAAGRSMLKSGRSGSKAMEASLYAAGESWWISFAEMFYESWLAQKEVEAAASQLERRRDLRVITERRLKRGTSESADFLQVQSAVGASMNDLEIKMLQLRSRWRALVISLYWPESFLDIDPRIVPLNIDDSIEESSKICSSLKLEEFQRLNQSIRAADERAQSQAAYAQAKHLNKWPELRAFAEISAANSEPKMGDAFSDSMGFKNSGWTIGFKLDVPLFHWKEREDIETAQAESWKARATSAQVKSHEFIRFKTDCDSMQSQLRVLEEQRIILNRLASRENELNRRFRIGDASAFEMVQAGDDRTQAEMGLHRLEVERRLSSLRIVAAAGGLKESLKKAFQSSSED